MKKGDVMKVMKTKTFDGFVGLSDQIIFCLRDFLSPVHDTWKAHLLCKRVIIITASAQVLTIIFDFVSVWFLFALLGFLHVFFFQFIYFIYFWLRWIFVVAHGLSLVAVSGGYSSLWCAGFSLRWLLLLQSTGSRAQAQ